MEIGSRWNEEAYQFIRHLAKAKARSAPAVLQRSLQLAWIRRWTGMIAFAGHDAFAASLLEELPAYTVSTDGEQPWLGHMLAQDASEEHLLPGELLASA